MSINIPSIGYRELAARNASVTREIDKQQLSRLTTCCEPVSKISAEFTFHRTEQGLCEVRGQARCRVALTCQTCAEQVAIDLAVPLQFTIVNFESQADDLAANEDVVFVNDPAKVALVELVEDDLILALPTQACQDDACPNRPAMEYLDNNVATAVARKTDNIPVESSSSGEVGPRQRPFTQLKSLIARASDDTDEQEGAED